MKRRADVQKLANDLGASLEEYFNGYRGAVHTVAPRGSKWACSAGVLHVLVEPFSVGDKTEAWTDLFDRMVDGLVKCEVPDCDSCGEEG